MRDVQRRARWLPESIKMGGLAAAYQQRWRTLPDDVQATLTAMRIPQWMIALISTEPGPQDEILKQFRFMTDLAGDPPTNAIAARAEQLLIFGGSAQLPTPGDNTTGASLGAEGCTAAMSKYVVAVLMAEFPQQLGRLSPALATSQSSVETRSLFQAAAQQGLVQLYSRAFAQLTPNDFQPGSLTIAQKPGGTHVFAWTRVPAGWNWDPSDKMAIGNTGLVQFGDRMILAQEYVTGHPELPGELEHNQHGPINSRNVIYVDGKPDLTDPRTNVYAVQGSNFILIRFVDPATA
ncbi:MAG: hypothetical protein JO267_02400 [Alphaproteobacteria bacterium]|nr:hypothetical protein [Alphaproteobacteria bacterium]